MLKKIERTHKIIWLLSVVFSLSIGVLIGSLSMMAKYRKYNDPEIAKIIEAYETLKDQWYFGKDIENYDAVLAEAAINGMTNNGDPYTFYTKNMESQGLSTSYYGIGISSSYYGGNRYLMDVFPNSPADQAGLKRGDVIIGLEKKQTYYELKQLSRTEGENLFRFEKDEKAQIFYQRGEKNYQTEVTAGPYEVPGLIVEERTPTLLNIRIETFLDNSVSSLLQNSIDSYLKEYQHLDHLVLDFRDNGGGYVNAAVKMSSLFVPHNATILTYEYQSGKKEVIKNTGYPRYDKEEIGRISILQNYNTASSSEIVILAMRDLCSDWAKIYGTKSYGKGIAQNFQTFADGSVIRYTFAQSYGPNGYSIHNVGIEPDVFIDIDTRLLLTYLGEKTQFSYAEQELLKEQISLILQKNYSTYESALQAWLSFTQQDSFNKEAAQQLQVSLFDIFLSLNQSILSKAKENA